MPTPPQDIVGVILAGGLSSRMQYRDKALLPLGGRPLIAHIIENAQAQTGQLLLNVNRAPENYASFGLPVLGDAFGEGAGPLAGILTAMEYCVREGLGQRLACFPGDVPWFPGHLVADLEAQLDQEDAQVSCVKTGTQWQPLFSLWSLELLPAIRQALDNRVYSPMMLIQTLPHSVLHLETVESGHFDNLNTPEELARAQALLDTRQGV